MKKYLLLLAIVIAVVVGGERLAPEPAASSAIADAFRTQAENLPVRGEGEVEAVLPDDTRGSRHQRFILRLAQNHTLLIAHNIDLAPRIPALQRGDTVGFKGIYEWNPEGGVVHWTHHDPAGGHPGGWLTHGGERYE